MNQSVCKHCGGPISHSDLNCPNCGIPLLAGKKSSSQRKFILFFIAVVLFCAFMILWLPPDWVSFTK